MKKKGSALVLGILTLAFFTVMSMNIYYLGQKKAESAWDKTTGEQITNDIDIASSIVYQEAYLAENFVRLGVPYDSDHPAEIDTYTVPSSDKNYFNYSDGTYSKKYAGIQLNEISEYFDSNWDSTLDDIGGYDGIDTQKLIMSEVVENGKVKSRIWQSGGVPSKTTKLWEDPSLFSIGGYQLTNITLDDDEITSISKINIENKLSKDKTYSMEAIFEKIVQIEGNDDTNDEDYIPSMNFKITVTENVTLDTSEGTDLSSDVEFYDSAISMAIEKQE